MRTTLVRSATRTLAALALALPACAALAQAAPATGTVNAMGAVMDMLDNNCQPLIAKITSDGQLQPALADRPIDVKTVCGCMRAATSADARVVQIFTGEQAVLMQRMADPRLKAYLTGRFLQAAFDCVSRDLDKSLTALKLVL